MRIDQLQVELRPRSPWEAVDLGTALVRRHRRAIWRPWLLATVPVFVLGNAIGWWFDLVPWAGLVLWWLKPVFDRIPLFVISRAVFGEVPSTRTTLAAQLRWGWRPMLHYLTWRRLGMARALYLPIDLLEGGDRPGERRRVIGGAARGVAIMLTFACANFELMLAIALLALGALFVPLELLSESARAAWALLTQQPSPAALVVLNAAIWFGTTLVEPVYVGAGFGLYLNRRTQIEAWDIEIAFRRMRQRLAAGATLAVCAIAFGMALPIAAHAQAPLLRATATGTVAQCKAPAPDSVAADTATTKGFVSRLSPDTRFDAAVARAYADPLLSPRRKQAFWEPRTATKEEVPNANPLLAAIAGFIAMLGEYALWLLLAIGVIALLVSHRHWRPWLRASLSPRAAPATPVVTEVLPVEEQLPTDIAATARALWREGRLRRALALLYRASVQSMVARTGTVLVPGATEAECLRAARALRAPEDRDAFASAVRVWQYAAYAERMPDNDDFERLLAQLSGRFGWAA